MKDSRLFDKRRACECCQRSATSHHRKEDEPNILTISMILSFKGAGKSMQKATKAIRICTDCLAFALASPNLAVSTGPRTFTAAIRERLSVSYSWLLDRDAMDQVVRPSLEDQGSLLETA